MLVLLSLICLLQVAVCANIVVHEKREFPLDDDNIIDRQPIQGDTPLPMRIGFQQNAEALAHAEEWLMDVSDPDSPNFGQHWTQTEVIEAFKPSVESVKAVRVWLAQHGIKQVTYSDNKQWLAFELPASVAESLLQTKYFEHQTEKGKFEASCDEYSLPEDLTNLIDYITPGIKSKDITFRSRRSREYFAKDSKARPDRVQKRFPPGGTATLKQTTVPVPPNDLQHCHWSTSPACVRALYNFTVADPSIPVSPNNTLGIIETYYLTLQRELNEFFSYFTNIPNGTAPIFHSIDGAVFRPNQTRGWREYYSHGSWRESLDSESTLDYEAIFPIIYPQNITTFQTDDPYRSYWAGAFDNDALDGIDGSYCTFTAYNITGNSPGDLDSNKYHDPVYPDPHPHGWHHPLQCGVFQPTNVLVSTSINWEQYTVPAYSKRQCLEFLKLALQGVSTINSSGDGGAACRRRLNKSHWFNVAAPPSCPWVTGVGATQIQPYHSPSAPEEVVNLSTGGFSDFFSRPGYQDQAITEYFENHNPPYKYYYNGHHINTTGSYNRNGRGVPDVAAIGAHFAGIAYDGWKLFGGTSVSAPLFGALINRIIEERIKVGKGPLGFLNPTMYKNPHAFHDITIGTNGAPPPCAFEGFKAVPGWDPTTGLGTPNYPKLLEVFMNLP